MKLYMFRTVPLSVIRNLFTVHSAMEYVIEVCRQLSSRSICSCSKAEISATIWFYYKEICYDARSHERKKHTIISIFENISNKSSDSKYQYEPCYVFNIILSVYRIFKHSRPTVGATSNSLIDCRCSFDAESMGVMTSRRWGVEGNSILDCTQNCGNSLTHNFLCV